MDLLGWVLYAVAAAAAFVIVGYLYRRREMPGRGRTLLAGVRWLALALLILLLFDPKLPSTSFIRGGDRTWVLLDNSLSMLLPEGEPGGRSRWQGALEEARKATTRGEVLLFGSEVRRVPLDSLASRTPAAGGSLLAPALRAAAEGGARRVVVFTDGGIEDLAEVNRLLPQLGLEVDVRTVGTAPALNRSLAEVEAPEWVEAGKLLEIQVGVRSTAPGGDSVRVVARQGGKVVAEGKVASPAAGRVSTTTLRFKPEGDKKGESVRYEVAIEGEDAVADDNVRSLYVHVGAKPVGVALVSFRPDWEPRALQPVLEQALGLPVQGFLALKGERFVRIGAGTEGGRMAGAAEVKDALARAELVVLHGLDGAAPAWAREAAKSARRVLLFPGEGGSADAGVSLPAPAVGDWYAQGEIPPSPVAALLASLPVADLPALSDLRPVTIPAGGWAPLVASRDRKGRGGSPVVVAGEREGKRSAVVAAEGFWRWAFEGDEGRQAYRRLWGAVGGWLLEEKGRSGGDALRPLRRVAERGEPMRWLASDAVDSVALRVLDEQGAVALERTLAREHGDTLLTPALPPGHYRYEAKGFAKGEATAPAAGTVSVERYSPDFARLPVGLEGGAAVALAGVAPVAPRNPGTPLHTTTWPYLLMALLVSGEWILRRRWGLR
jgi:hypothetical protein